MTGVSTRGVVGRSAGVLALALTATAVLAAYADAGRAALRVQAATIARAERPPASATSRASPRAPTGAPLVSGPAAIGGPGESSEASGPQPGEVDPLVGNGLRSPLCRGVLGRSELARANARDCETSGFVAAAAPTGDYGIDVHIDTGFLSLSRGGLLTVVQDLFIQPLWMAIVWAVHALIVLLEWGFTIDLLDSPTVRESVGAGLQRMQLAVTLPWLGLALSCASVLALYNGVIRRRVAETLGQALALVAMIATAIWLTLDPTGTVGAVGGWANEASLGTLAATARGTPARAGDALATSMSDVFAAAVEVPWCYLEFGDVDWCRDPARLEPELHAAALRIAGEELASAGCKAGTGACAPSSTRARGLAHSAQLLREARTNGAIFLALPANGPARNSINDSGSPLHVMCRSSEATACRGPMAAAAEFRTDAGTWPRVGGLLLIAAGLAGMLLTLGFIAARLLAAALFSLFYLLMAPAAALAPAFGERGRRLFGRWATQLFAAVVSKLLFSFLLGVMLAVAAILSALAALGFWTQWLLMSVFWWGAFARREHVLALAGGGNAAARGGGRLGLARRLRARGGPPGIGLRRAHDALRRLGGPAPSVESRRRLIAATREHARASAAGQAERLLANEYRGATSAGDDATANMRARTASLSAQLERVRGARSEAATGGDTRRLARLDHRAVRIEHELEGEREALGEASRAGSPSAAAHERRAPFLDDQAALPASRERHRSHAARDYAALAGLLGYTRREYEGLGPGRQRAARLELDRELALRREIGAATRDVARAADARATKARERGRAERALEGALERRMRAAGESMPASRADSSAIGRWRAGASTPKGPRRGAQSRVMEDARAVAERRKRQLGFGRD